LVGAKKMREMKEMVKDCEQLKTRPPEKGLQRLVMKQK